MTGQSCAAVCVVLCVLAATAHSFSFNEVPSAYDDDVPPAYGDDNGFPEEQALDDYYGRFPEEQALDDYYGQRTDIELQSNPEMTYFPSDTAEGFPIEQAVDDNDFYGQRSDTELPYTPEMYYDTAEVERLTFDIDPSKIKVRVIGTEICVSYEIFEFCFEKSQARELICGHRLGKILTLGCRKDEEKYLGLCFKKCSILTNKNYPKRTATNTCAKNGCSSNQEKQAGLCYPKCRQYYKGVGPICWGSCSHFCGDKFKNTGLTCHRWWPPKSCKKPRYGRGVGTLPYKPWTKGLGCNGFGVNGDGGCAKIDVLKYIKLPFGIKC